MYAHTLLSSLALVSSALATPQWWAPRPNCNPEPVTVSGVGYEIGLKLQGSDFDGQYVKVSEDGPGEYTAVIGDRGYIQNFTLQAGNLWVWDGTIKAALEPLDNTNYLQQLSFDYDPENPVEFEASYFCNNGKEDLELKPAYQYPATAKLSFCLAYDWTGTPQIALKYEDRPEDECQDVKLIVVSGTEEEEGDDGWNPAPTDDWWATTSTRPSWQTTTPGRPVTVTRTVRPTTTTRRPPQQTRPPQQGGGGATRTVIVSPQRPTTAWNNGGNDWNQGGNGGGGGNNGGNDWNQGGNGGGGGNNGGNGWNQGGNGGGGGNNGGVTRTVILSP